MPVSIPDFWNLMLASRMASPVSVSSLQAKFNQVKGAENESNTATLAQWLIAQGVLSAYQAKVLLAGQPGPFHYGEYTVYDRIPNGRLQGMFRALHPATRFRVLLYFHTGAVVQNAQWWSVLVEQLAQAAKVIHPHVARVYHLCDVGQFKFTSIEDLQGETAEELLRAGPIHWAVAARMVRQAALGLARMHEHKQLHGAIRPENLWIDKEENAKLLMIPAARNAAATLGSIDLSAVQQSEDVLRQADYLAPEMGQAGQMPGPWTDVYALGCTLFQMLTGRSPFVGRDLLSKLASHASERIPSLDSAAVPAPIHQIVVAMMAKDPARRVQRPRQVADAIGQVLQQLDPAQLQWPASAISNKLPEYESWLQPYQLSTDQQRTWAPEISTPPILAASLRAEEPRPGIEFAPSPPTQSRPAKGPASAADVSTTSRTWSGGDSLRTTPPPVRPALPRGTTAGGLVPRPADAANAPPPKRKAQTGPGDLIDSMPAMVFPPDEADAVISFTTADRSLRKRGNQRMLISVAAVVAFVLVIVLLVVSMRPTVQEGSKAKDKVGAAGTGEPDKSSTPVETSRPNEKEPKSEKEEKAPAKSGNDVSEGSPVDTPSKPLRHLNLHLRFVSYAEASEVEATSAAARNESAAAKETKAAKETGPPEAAARDMKNNTLWASPTHGRPLSLAYLAPSIQAVLVLRPADLMQRADRDKVFAALGPAGEAAGRELRSYTGVLFSEIEELTIGWIDQIGAGGEAAIAPMYVFRFKQAVDREKLRTQWGYGSAIDLGLVYQTVRGFSAYLPQKENGKVLVIGPAECLSWVEKFDGAAPPVYRELEKLLQATDSQRLATLLWLPSQAIGSEELVAGGGPWQTLLNVARKFVGDDARGASLSVHLADDNFFVELLVRGPLDTTPQAVAKQLQSRLAKLPGNVDAWIQSLHVLTYDDAVLKRFGTMVKLVGEYTRAGANGDLAVLRCYLPAVAAHNLLMASELALAGGAAGNVAVGNTAGPATAETLSQKLQRVTSLSFTRDTLEKAIQMLADDIGLKAEIAGPDLQLEGITKNQSFGLDEQNKTAAEILAVIMLRANPDGKLVYVVKSSEPGGEETLFITTRAAAAKRGDKLPAEFMKAPAKK